MTLIELLTYIGILAIIMLGSVFSAYSILISTEKSNYALASSTQESNLLRDSIQ